MTVEQFSNTLGIDLLDKSREVRFTYARYAVYYYLRRRGWCLMRIADMFGYKSHSSIINGLKQMEAKLSINDDIAHGYWKKLLVADSARIEKLKLGMAASARR